MPRLQILHHKSYHPYNEKNKQRVREDEAKAAAEQLAREQRDMEIASEARLTELRRRAGSPEDNLPSTSSSRPAGDSLLERHRKEKARQEKRERKARDRLDFDFPSEAKGKGKAVEVEADSDRQAYEDRFTSGGHLNFWADLENGKDTPAPVPTLADMAKKKAEQEADRFTMYLGRPERETKPWYTDRELKRVEDKETGERAEERRARDRRKDVRSKERHDPLTSIRKSLAAPSASATKAGGRGGGGGQSERERALALIAKRKGEPERRGNPWDTPDSAAGWTEDFERRKDLAGHKYTSSWDTPRRARRGWEV
ncbi:hypothetical protein VHUM_02000 [Vanrija humicola]|uniref:CBF1-interacting co-repressor CIR N-terminal domain-containing protein n=1 Tax=Vanrija humicola TaxID=5417 RepID=A0A7D8V226_VANHU|nr:hypothetical protein VHUM_02000 [Vanrija humicola]